MSSPISSALERLDGSLLALQSEVDCLRAGLEVSDDQLSQRLTDARQHATAVRDLIRAERADAAWADRKALDQLIHDLELAAREKRNQERRTRLLELASEFEAGNIRHRFESRVSSLQALRQEAVQQLRADAARPEQQKVLPGPEAGEWLHWACNLQEEADAPTLDELQKDFPAVAAFTGEMEETYWVPGTRAPVSAAPAPRPPQPAAPPVTAPPVKEVKPPEPVRVSKEPPPIVAPPPPAAKPPAPAPAMTAAAQTKPVEPPARPEKKPVPEPMAPALGKVAVAATAATVEKPKPTAAAQTKTAPAAAAAPAAKRVEPPKDVRPAPEPASSPAANKQWAAAAAPAKEPERKAVAAVTPVTPPAAAPRMKYCDKCGSTYPAQFNVCPIDSSPLRFTSEPAPAAARDDSSDKKRDKVDKAVVVAAAPAKAASSTTSGKAATDSAKAEFAELRETIRHRSEDETLAVEDQPSSDWQTMLHDKNWRALAANPVVLAGATLVLVLVVGGILWKAHRSHVANDSVKAMEKAPEATAANTQPSGIVTNSAAQPLDASLSTQGQAKPADPNAAAKANPKDAQQKPANQPDSPAKPAQVLSLPMPAPRDGNSAKKTDVAANEPIEPPSSIPGALPNTSPNNLGSIAKDVPVAVPTLTPQKLRVSSGVAQAQITHQVTPQYPPEAMQTRVHGTVVLQAVIGKDGNVKNLKVVSGPSMLIKSATEAVKQWRYRPFTLNGEPVEADTQINVNFNLGEQ